VVFVFIHQLPAAAAVVLVDGLPDEHLLDPGFEYPSAEGVERPENFYKTQLKYIFGLHPVLGIPEANPKHRPGEALVERSLLSGIVP
jgi:hypothetical protein